MVELQGKKNRPRVHNDYWDFFDESGSNGQREMGRNAGSVFKSLAHGQGQHRRLIDRIRSNGQNEIRPLDLPQGNGDPLIQPGYRLLNLSGQRGRFKKRGPPPFLKTAETLSFSRRVSSSVSSLALITLCSTSIGWHRTEWISRLRTLA